MDFNLISAKQHIRSSVNINFLVLLLLFSTIQICAGQRTQNAEKIVVGDSRYYLHTVQKKETLYSISRQYDCSQEEVLAANKQITGIIKKGMILKIPDHSYQIQKKSDLNEDQFIKYLTVSGDNYYQLKLRYGVSEEELVQLNPDLKEGLRAGKTIRIPVKTRPEISEKELPESPKLPRENSLPYQIKSSDQNIQLGLYLPISAAIADSLKPTAKALSFLAFYQGTMMAVEQATKTGYKIKLYVYDTEKTYPGAEILLKKPEFLSLDLLIGPVYPEIQRQFSEVSAKNRIPMVSPLSTDDKYTKTNPWYFQVNPIRRLRLETTADYLLKEFSKERIIFLEDGNLGSDTRFIHETLLKKGSSSGIQKDLLKSFNLWAGGIESLEVELNAEKPNVLVLADMNEVNVSIAMNRLALISKKFPLLLVGIQEFTKMQSIETENLHDVNLHFLSTTFVDYNRPEVNTFAENFKTEFGTEPSLFAFQGFDITTWFLNSLMKSEKPTVSAMENNKGLLQAEYHFGRVSDLGGFTNDAFKIVVYSSSYEVKSKGVIRRMD
jgi:ABC-type branched-subunit amino acid transport system substrate-binding protein/LysM repeat protein